MIRQPVVAVLLIALPLGIALAGLGGLAGVLTADDAARGAGVAPVAGPASESLEVAAAPVGLPVPGVAQAPLAAHAFALTRAIYSSGFDGRRFNSWATDYPKSDQQFVSVLKRLTSVSAYPLDNAMRLDDPDLRRFPFLYMVEVGSMNMTPAEVTGLRDYLLAGGFLMVDDFWGTQEWANFEREMRRVFPDREIVDLPLDHPIFRIFYEIDEVVQVPAIGNIRRGQTSERDGIVPYVRGILDDQGRLMVIIHWNTDLGDAWEWAEQPDYPLKYSTYAFRVGVNMVVWAMTN
jgi:hypothetical protein